jgi:hypothetical protein
MYCINNNYNQQKLLPSLFYQFPRVLFIFARNSCFTVIFVELSDKLPYTATSTNIAIYETEATLSLRFSFSLISLKQTCSWFFFLLTTVQCSPLWIAVELPFTLSYFIRRQFILAIPDSTKEEYNDKVLL